MYRTIQFAFFDLLEGVGSKRGKVLSQGVAHISPTPHLHDPLLWFSQATPLASLVHFLPQCLIVTRDLLCKEDVYLAPILPCHSYQLHTPIANMAK